METAARQHSNAGSAPSSREAQASGTAESVEFKTQGTQLNFLSDFKGLREEQRGLVGVTRLSYFTRRGDTDSWVHSEGLRGRNRAAFGSRLLNQGVCKAD